MVVAIRRERAIKHWSRTLQLELIEGLNPEWRNLSDGWYGEHQFASPA